MNGHLSSEAMERQLAGAGDKSSAKHLSACTACAVELAEMERLLGGMRQSAVAVADQQWKLAEAGSRVTPKTFGTAGWVWAACAAVMLAVGVPVEMHRHGAAVPVAPQQVASLQANAQDAALPQVADNTPAKAMTDEALLETIQNDLSTSVPQPLQPLAVTSTTTSSTNRSSSRTQSVD